MRIAATEKCFVVRADEKLRFWNSNRLFEVAVNCLDKLASFFQNYPGYETKDSIGSNHICARLLCAFTKSTSSCPGARRGLSQLHHSRRAKRPF